MTKTTQFCRSALALCTGAALLTATSAAAELNKVQLEVIVGNHTDTFTTEYTMPFFNEQLAERSDGRVSANAKPYTELGLSGFEMMDLLKLGTNDISWGVPGYISGDSPIAEGLDLPGLSADLDVIKEAQIAYRSILDHEYNSKFNARLMMMYTQPKLQAYCRLSEDEIANFSLDSLKGKKTRVHATSFADFAEAAGMIPVTMAFADVVPALERGVLDCAISSPNAAYGYKWGQVTNAVVDLPAGFATQVVVMNSDTWNDLNEETQGFLTEQFADLEARMAEHTVVSTTQSAQCLHDGPCPLGDPAGMALLQLNAEDEAKLNTAIEETVLARWGERCGTDCSKTWNETMTPIVGMTIPVE
ncbi:TRAP transporter substrate-binding protein DctP [Celeribacter naphthalenivorans]|uniref:TRAP transporter substrate-binding protein DctP n=1 Tax=Celeribacter naphthalenivorans TaxID=1614694 RepID=UPI001CF9EE89|nr:TRAP transporter substrate-binding protein DctP [Celeribacter naphthalenivorans]